MTSNDTATPGKQLERGAGVAVWRQIEQILTAEIAASGFGEEGRLPSEGELAKRFDVNRHTVRRAMLGLAEFPHLTFDGAARFGSAHWKLGPLDEYARGRALAWVDDNLDDSCYRWARERDEPTLLVPTDPALGLQEAETEALIAWGRGLAVEAGE